MSFELSQRSQSRLRRGAYGALIGVSLFHALSAVGGGIGMLVTDGLSMPKSLLADSPFSTFLLPALILAVVVGGTQSIASALLLRHRPSALLWSAVAGFGMIIWIVSEIGFIHALEWAQLIYLVSGLLQLLLVFALLGIVGWLPSGPVLDVHSTRTTADDVIVQARDRVIETGSHLEAESILAARDAERL